MCLSDIGQVTEVGPTRYSAVVDVDGRTVAVSTVALGIDEPDVEVDDWLVVHTGLAVERLAEADARRILDARREHVTEPPTGGRPS